jgi:hypothetical protein
MTEKSRRCGKLVKDWSELVRMISKGEEFNVRFCPDKSRGLYAETSNGEMKILAPIYSPKSPRLLPTIQGAVNHDQYETYLLKVFSGKIIFSVPIDYSSIDLGEGGLYVPTQLGPDPLNPDFSNFQKLRIYSSC